MHFVYVDEAGDSGYFNSPSDAFTLGLVMIDDRDWLDALDGLVNYRRYLRQNFGLRMSDEIKAKYLLHNKGPVSPQSRPGVPISVSPG